MKDQLKYIELKSGFSDNGPAWIGKVEFSKTGKTIYFNGKSFKGNGHGLCSDIITREVYWISGIKNNGQDRHWAGRGKIMIDKKVVKEYLEIVGQTKLDTTKFEEVEIEEINKTKFNEIENETLSTQQFDEKYKDLSNLTIKELADLISKLKWRENNTNSNNGLKYITVKRIEAEKIMEHLIADN